MPPEYRLVVSGGHPIAVPSGDLDLATNLLFEELLNSAAEHSEYIAVDLGAVSYMDCTALTVLLRAHHAARSRGGAVVLLNVASLCRRVLTITHVQDELTIYETLDEAIVACQRCAHPAKAFVPHETRPHSKRLADSMHCRTNRSVAL